MSEAGEAVQAIGGLIVGGIIFITFGTALAGTALEGSAFIDFRVWGVIYFLTALVLAILFVGGILAALFSNA